MVTVLQPLSTTQLVVTVPNLGGAAGTIYFPILALPSSVYRLPNYDQPLRMRSPPTSSRIRRKALSLVEPNPASGDSAACDRMGPLF